MKFSQLNIRIPIRIQTFFILFALPFALTITNQPSIGLAQDDINTETRDEHETNGNSEIKNTHTENPNNEDGMSSKDIPLWQTQEFKDVEIFLKFKDQWNELVEKDRVAAVFLDLDSSNLNKIKYKKIDNFSSALSIYKELGNHWKLLGSQKEVSKPIHIHTLELGSHDVIIEIMSQYGKKGKKYNTIWEVPYDIKNLISNLETRIKSFESKYSLTVDMGAVITLEEQRDQLRLIVDKIEKFKNARTRKSKNDTPLTEKLKSEVRWYNIANDTQLDRHTLESGNIALGGMNPTNLIITLAKQGKTTADIGIVSKKQSGPITLPIFITTQNEKDSDKNKISEFVESFKRPGSESLRMRVNEFYDKQAADFFKLAMSQLNVNDLHILLQEATAHAMVSQRYDILELVLKDTRINPNSKNNREKTQLGITIIMGDRNVFDRYMHISKTDPNLESGIKNIFSPLEGSLYQNNGYAYEVQQISMGSDVYKDYPGAPEVWYQVFARNNLDIQDPDLIREWVRKNDTNFNNDQDKHLKRENVAYMANQLWEDSRVTTATKNSLKDYRRSAIAFLDQDLASSFLKHLDDSSSGKIVTKKTAIPSGMVQSWVEKSEEIIGKLFTKSGNVSSKAVQEMPRLQKLLEEAGFETKSVFRGNRQVLEVKPTSKAKIYPIVSKYFSSNLKENLGEFKIILNPHMDKGISAMAIFPFGLEISLSQTHIQDLIQGNLNPDILHEIKHFYANAKALNRVNSVHSQVFASKNGFTNLNILYAFGFFTDEMLGMAGDIKNTGKSENFESIAKTILEETSYLIENWNSLKLEYKDQIIGSHRFNVFIPYKNGEEFHGLVFDDGRDPRTVSHQVLAILIKLNHTAYNSLMKYNQMQEIVINDVAKMKIEKQKVANEIYNVVKNDKIVSHDIPLKQDQKYWKYVANKFPFFSYEKPDEQKKLGGVFVLANIHLDAQRKTPNKTFGETLADVEQLKMFISAWNQKFENGELQKRYGNVYNADGILESKIVDPASLKKVQNFFGIQKSKELRLLTDYAYRQWSKDPDILAEIRKNSENKNISFWDYVTSGEHSASKPEVVEKERSKDNRRVKGPDIAGWVKTIKDWNDSHDKNEQINSKNRLALFHQSAHLSSPSILNKICNKNGIAGVDEFFELMKLFTGNPQISNDQISKKFSENVLAAFRSAYLPDHDGNTELKSIIMATILTHGSEDAYNPRADLDKDEETRMKEELLRAFNSDYREKQVFISKTYSDKAHYLEALNTAMDMIILELTTETDKPNYYDLVLQYAKIIDSRSNLKNEETHDFETVKHVWSTPITSAEVLEEIIIRYNLENQENRIISKEDYHQKWHEVGAMEPELLGEYLTGINWKKVIERSSSAEAGGSFILTSLATKTTEEILTFEEYIARIKAWNDQKPRVIVKNESTFKNAPAKSGLGSLQNFKRSLKFYGLTLDEFFGLYKTIMSKDAMVISEMRNSPRFKEPFAIFEKVMQVHPTYPPGNEDKTFLLPIIVSKKNLNNQLKDITEYRKGESIENTQINGIDGGLFILGTQWIQRLANRTYQYVLNSWTQDLKSDIADFNRENTGIKFSFDQNEWNKITNFKILREARRIFNKERHDWIRDTAAIRDKKEINSGSMTKQPIVTENKYIPTKELIKNSWLDTSAIISFFKNAYEYVVNGRHNDKLAETITPVEADIPVSNLPEVTSVQSMEKNVENYFFVQRWNKTNPTDMILNMVDLGKKMETLPISQKPNKQEALEILADQWSRVHTYFLEHPYKGRQKFSDWLVNNWRKLPIPDVFPYFGTIHQLNEAAGIDKNDGKRLISNVFTPQNPYLQLRKEHLLSIWNLPSIGEKIRSFNQLQTNQGIADEKAKIHSVLTYQEHQTKAEIPPYEIFYKLCEKEKVTPQDWLHRTTKPNTVYINGISMETFRPMLRVMKQTIHNKVRNLQDYEFLYKRNRVQHDLLQLEVGQSYPMEKFFNVIIDGIKVWNLENPESTIVDQSTYEKYAQKAELPSFPQLKKTLAEGTHTTKDIFKKIQTDPKIFKDTRFDKLLSYVERKTQPAQMNNIVSDEQIPTFEVHKLEDKKQMTREESRNELSKLENSILYWNMKNPANKEIVSLIDYKNHCTKAELKSSEQLRDLLYISGISPDIFFNPIKTKTNLVKYYFWKNRYMETGELPAKLGEIVINSGNSNRDFKTLSHPEYDLQYENLQQLMRETGMNPTKLYDLYPSKGDKSYEIMKSLHEKYGLPNEQSKLEKIIGVADKSTQQFFLPSKESLVELIYQYAIYSNLDVEYWETVKKYTDKTQAELEMALQQSIVNNENKETKFLASMTQMTTRGLLVAAREAASSNKIEALEYLLDLKKMPIVAFEEALKWGAISGHLEIVKYMGGLDSTTPEMFEKALEWVSSSEDGKMVVIKYLASHSKMPISGLEIAAQSSKKPKIQEYLKKKIVESKIAFENSKLVADQSGIVGFGPAALFAENGLMERWIAMFVGWSQRIWQKVANIDPDVTPEEKGGQGQEQPQSDEPPPEKEKQHPNSVPEHPDVHPSEEKQLQNLVDQMKGLVGNPIELQKALQANQAEIERLTNELIKSGKVKPTFEKLGDAMKAIEIPAVVSKLPAEFGRFFSSLALVHLYHSLHDEGISTQTFVDILQSLPTEFLHFGTFSIAASTASTTIDAVSMVREKLMQQQGSQALAELKQVQTASRTPLSVLRTEASARMYVKGQFGMLAGTIVNMMLYDRGMTGKQILDSAVQTQVSFMIAGAIVRGVVIRGGAIVVDGLLLRRGLTLARVGFEGAKVSTVVGVVALAAELIVADPINRRISRIRENSEYKAAMYESLLRLEYWLAGGDVPKMVMKDMCLAKSDDLERGQCYAQQALAGLESYLVQMVYRPVHELTAKYSQKQNDLEKESVGAWEHLGISNSGEPIMMDAWPRNNYQTTTKTLWNNYALESKDAVSEIRSEIPQTILQHLRTLFPVNAASPADGMSNVEVLQQTQSTLKEQEKAFYNLADLGHHQGQKAEWEYWKEERVIKHQKKIDGDVMGIKEWGQLAMYTMQRIGLRMQPKNGNRKLIQMMFSQQLMNLFNEAIQEKLNVEATPKKFTDVYESGYWNYAYEGRNFGKWQELYFWTEGPYYQGTLELSKREKLKAMSVQYPAQHFQKNTISVIAPRGMKKYERRVDRELLFDLAYFNKCKSWGQEGTLVEKFVKDKREFEQNIDYQKIKNDFLARVNSNNADPIAASFDAMSSVANQQSVSQKAPAAWFQVYVQDDVVRFGEKPLIEPYAVIGITQQQLQNYAQPIYECRY